MGNKATISTKFDVPSVYINGVYYFTQDIEINERKGEINTLRCNLPHSEINKKPFKIEAVYYDGKWRQDTHFITAEFREMLLNTMKRYSKI